MLNFVVQILPKIFYELSQVREEMDVKKNELIIYDHAIEEIEKNYGDFLYSPQIFAGNES